MGGPACSKFSRSWILVLTGTWRPSPGSSPNFSWVTSSVTTSPVLSARHASVVPSDPTTIVLPAEADDRKHQAHASLPEDCGEKLKTFPFSSYDEAAARPFATLTLLVHSPTASSAPLVD